jgi:hypothetical protein
MTNAEGRAVCLEAFVIVFTAIKVAGPKSALITYRRFFDPAFVKTLPARIAFLLAILLPACPRGQAQTLSFGFSAGLPLNPLATATGNQVTSTGRYAFGPTLQVALPHGFGVDVEFIYKRFDFGSVSDSARAAVHRVELPLMLRYSFPGLPLRPFAHMGMNFNRVIAVGGANVCAQGGFGEEIYCLGERTEAVLRHRRTHGPVVGAGVEFRWGGMRLAPELRITRWVDRNFGTRDTALRSNLTGVDLLLAARFR